MHELSRLYASDKDGLSFVLTKLMLVLSVRRLGKGASLEDGWRGSMLMVVVRGAAALGCKQYLN